MTTKLEDALCTAASAGDVEWMTALVVGSQESPPEETIQNILAAAARSTQPDVIDFLLTQYPSVTLNEEIVRAAVNSGSISVFEALLARDRSIINMQFDRRGTPLIVACMGQQRIEYLRCLLEAGADPNQDPDAASFPLALVAALYKDSAALDLLLQHGASLEHSGALAAASRLGNEAAICHLLDRGARVSDDAPATGAGASASPLHVAVRAGRPSVARILLQHGADAHVVDASGVTAAAVAEQMSLKGEDMSEMLKVLGCR